MLTVSLRMALLYIEDYFCVRWSFCQECFLCTANYINVLSLLSESQRIPIQYSKCNSMCAMKFLLRALQLLQFYLRNFYIISIYPITRFLSCLSNLNGIAAAYYPTSLTVMHRLTFCLHKDQIQHAVSVTGF